VGWQIAIVPLLPVLLVLEVGVDVGDSTALTVMLLSTRSIPGMPTKNGGRKDIMEDSSEVSFKYIATWRRIVEFLGPLSCWTAVKIKLNSCCQNLT
jgi:hypothetical protein